MVLRDAPDLQDDQNHIGIEVVVGSSSKDMKASRVFSDLCHREPKSGDAAEDDIKKLAQCGYSVRKLRDNCSTLNGGGTGDGEKKTFQERLRGKIQKIDCYHEHFNVIGLAVLMSETPTRYAENYFCDWIAEIVGNSEKSFDLYYVISHRFCICYDARTGESHERLINKDESYALSVIGKMTAAGELQMSDAEWQ